MAVSVGRSPRWNLIGQLGTTSAFLIDWFCTDCGRLGGGLRMEVRPGRPGRALSAAAACRMAGSARPPMAVGGLAVDFHRRGDIHLGSRARPGHRARESHPRTGAARAAAAARRVLARDRRCGANLSVCFRTALERHVSRGGSRGDWPGLLRDRSGNGDDVGLRSLHAPKRVAGTAGASGQRLDSCWCPCSRPS